MNDHDIDGIRNIAEMNLEAFDAIEVDTPHRFSNRYQRRKRRLLRDASGQAARPGLRVAAVLAACLVLPFAALAIASHTDFFKSAFGREGRVSVDAHEETFYEDEKDASYSVVFPGHEYVDVDEALAERLLGGAMLDDPIEIPINDHVLTVLSAVRDENVLVTRFTLACDTGVTALGWDAWSNESKGAYITEESTLAFRVEGANGCILVDPARSTDDCLYCVDYELFHDPLPEGEAPELVFTAYDAPIIGIDDSAVPTETRVSLPATAALETSAFASETGGTLALSPIGLRVRLDVGLGLDPDAAQDPGSLDRVAIRMRDGSEYVVFDDPGNVYNVGYICGSLDASVSLAFNRLVDPETVEAVTINGVKYRPQ